MWWWNNEHERQRKHDIKWENGQTSDRRKSNARIFSLQFVQKVFSNKKIFTLLNFLSPEEIKWHNGTCIYEKLKGTYCRHSCVFLYEGPAIVESNELWGNPQAIIPFSNRYYFTSLFLLSTHLSGFYHHPKTFNFKLLRVLITLKPFSSFLVWQCTKVNEWKPQRILYLTNLNHWAAFIMRWHTTDYTELSYE